MSYGSVRILQNRMMDAMVRTQHFLEDECGFTHDMVCAATLAMQFEALALTPALMDELNRYIEEVKNG